MRRVTASALHSSATDREAAALHGALGYETFDWLASPPLSRRSVLLRAVQASFDASRAAGGRHLVVETALAARLATANLTTARERLSAGARVATDRLHGHVISVLLGVEHCIVDDAHGKIRALWETWTKDAPSATFAPDWAAATAWIDDRRTDARA